MDGSCFLDALVSNIGAFWAIARACLRHHTPCDSLHGANHTKPSHVDPVVVTFVAYAPEPSKDTASPHPGVLFYQKV
jgi:hypothetical protein